MDLNGGRLRSRAGRRAGHGRGRRAGSIVNVSSQMGHVGGETRTVYCASKHGIEGLTKAMALDLAPHGIRVPGPPPPPSPGRGPGAAGGWGGSGGLAGARGTGASGAGEGGGGGSRTGRGIKLGRVRGEGLSGEGVGVLVVSGMEGGVRAIGVIEGKGAGLRGGGGGAGRRSHRVEPGARGRREVEGPARMPGQPGADLGLLVGAIVVEDHVDHLAGRHGALDRVEEADELLMPVALHAAADDRCRRAR